MAQSDTAKKIVPIEHLEQAYVLLRRLLLCLFVVAPMLLIGCIFVPNPLLFPGLGVAEALAGAILIAAIIYAKRCTGQIGRLLDERYVSMMMAPYIVGMVALGMGYRGGLLTKLRKIEPRN